jgi:hypothetical protein
MDQARDDRIFAEGDYGTRLEVFVKSSRCRKAGSVEGIGLPVWMCRMRALIAFKLFVSVNPL